MRKFRTDELRSGLAAIATTYHRLTTDDPSGRESKHYTEAISRISKTISSLALNANDELAVQSLLLQCPTALTVHASSRVE
jgi:hypothetical protein